MTLDEIARLFKRSRRTIQRMVLAGKLPGPIEMSPMSWDDREVRQAHKGMQANHGQHKDGRTKSRSRTARLARPKGRAENRT